MLDPLPGEFVYISMFLTFPLYLIHVTVFSFWTGPLAYLSPSTVSVSDKGQNLFWTIYCEINIFEIIVSEIEINKILSRKS